MLLSVLGLFLIVPKTGLWQASLVRLGLWRRHSEVSPYYYPD